ncbi:MAG: lipoyl synthase [Anaerolineae bacterium]|nr:lipoyl synthase [Anaerolineae bacterium]MDW8069700.1 lipoyl synthase [Anaerolineae bacterium]
MCSVPTTVVAEDEEPARPPRRPEWLRVPLRESPAYHELKRLMRSLRLHTVCEEANCPNIRECWGCRTATFLILGDVCTRACRFCNVRSGHPAPPDPEEPRRVAEAVRVLGLRHAVITSVTRDDLPDGGATVFAEVIRQIRALNPTCTVEVLIPDFQGDLEPLRVVMEARPDVLNHNVETVPRLFPRVQPRNRYEWSLSILENAHRMAPGVLTKSGLMVGLGETVEEVLAVMADLRAVRVDVLTIGQYLQPTRRHWPVERYYPPEEFEEFRQRGREMGFRWVESGPLVRSSFHAARQMETLQEVIR